MGNAIPQRAAVVLYVYALAEGHIKLRKAFSLSLPHPSHPSLMFQVLLSTFLSPHSTGENMKHLHRLTQTPPLHLSRFQLCRVKPSPLIIGLDYFQRADFLPAAQKLPSPQKREAICAEVRMAIIRDVEI